MDNRRVALAGILIFFLFTATIATILLSDESTQLTDSNTLVTDPLIQNEGHDHRNASQHIFYTDNIQPISFNQLTAPGNAEVQVADSPDGGTYAYIAGWSELHIVDVTNPENTTVTGVYVDPNTQVLDVKYLQYNGDEYVIVQNQLVDPGNADPNVGEWGDPAQVTVTLIDVSDKYNPTYVDAWYDADHPSGPHNLYTHMIDNEWYIFVANPDYEQCDIGQGDACGGITIAHLNFDGPSDSPRILKVGEAEVNWQNTLGGWIYIHDMTVQTWPGEDQQDPRYGRTYIYGAYWEAGLRIFDVSDVPHPQNSPIEYAFIAGGCAATLGTQLTCNWRAPEVGQWMEFADLDEDGQIDCGCTGNENGGRASYIHYAEPMDKMVDASHLGYPAGKMHLTFLATEVLETTVGTGLGYLIDTTEYEMFNGQVTFKPQVIHSWEIPFAEQHHIPGGEEWLLFSPHNSDAEIFETNSALGLPDQSLGGNWDGRIYLSSYHAGLWIIDIETLMLEGRSSELNRTEVHSVSTIGYHLPHGQDGIPLSSSYYDFGWTPFIWAAEYHNGYTYLSCITTGLYIVQLDIDKPYHVS
ncbi:MAG: hypothetical protein CL976_03085 [Euryarchaeota archaeon]|nr:hypothetical protein [Euryarchaeota archaeon]|tara:strand:+ start:1886 stop:3628 length:1743 start_codon:yes stop_codon:yes gene_type:complete